MAQKLSIAYLGPEGTNSDEAAKEFASRLGLSQGDVAYIDCPSISTVFEAVERGRSDYGVVPTENALEGAVTATLDNFAFGGGACKLGEVVLPIHHSLVAAPGTTVDAIRTIASHPQSLAQCRRYLAEHFPAIEQVATASTAESARMAAKEEGVAGISTAFAAQLYGAEVIEPQIEDHFGNETSFALIARPGAPAVFEGKRYKTSLALFMKEDKPGTLLMILSELSFAGLNMTMIQSRPTKQGLGDYMFFVDIDGREDDPNVQTALNCLRLKLREVKVIGCYPIK